MQEASFMYKCRRCGLVHGSVVCGSEHALGYVIKMVMGIELNVIGAPEPKMIDVHYCEDKGIGVTDFIGCSIK